MSVTVLQGDCRDVLDTLPDGRFQTVVTSPPYFGLRDYGTATWEGGNEECGHVEMRVGMSDKNTLGPTGHLPEGNAANVGRTRQFRDICGKCGARRIDRQMGLEPTPDEFVAALVEVFRKVRRVLRDDGTVWLNLGDSYAANRPYQVPPTKWADLPQGQGAKVPDGLKPKDLIGIPWRVAFALQADGWYLRQDIIWAKPNPMPESVRDRCTKAHEYVFLLSKGPRYFYDAEAVAEDAVRPEGPGNAAGNKYVIEAQTNPRHRTAAGLAGIGARDTRNRRSVWTITTQPFKEAHYAVMPPDLAEVCIRAGSKPGDHVLDPFGGAGTTGLVADRWQRHATLIELNPANVEMARERINRDAPLLAMAGDASA